MKTLKLPSSSSDFLQLSISFSGSDWQVGQMLLYKQVTWSVEPIWSQLRSIHTSHTRPRARTHTNTRTLIYKKKKKRKTYTTTWVSHTSTHTHVGRHKNTHTPAHRQIWSGVKQIWRGHTLWHMHSENTRNGKCVESVCECVSWIMAVWGGAVASPGQVWTHGGGQMRDVLRCRDSAGCGSSGDAEAGVDLLVSRHTADIASVLYGCRAEDAPLASRHKVMTVWVWTNQPVLIMADFRCGCIYQTMTTQQHKFYIWPRPHTTFIKWNSPDLGPRLSFFRLNIRIIL